MLTYTTLSNSVSTKYKVVGFIEDSKLKIGKQFNRIRIHDSKIIDKSFIKKYDVQEIIVSIQNIKPFQLFEKVDGLTNLPVSIKMVPPVKQWIDGELNVGQIKEIKIEDQRKTD